MNIYKYEELFINFLFFIAVDTFIRYSLGTKISITENNERTFSFTKYFRHFLHLLVSYIIFQKSEKLSKTLKFHFVQ